jgi:hypothetical protein
MQAFNVIYNELKVLRQVEKEIKQQNISALQQAADEIKVMFSAMEKPGKKRAVKPKHGH